MVVGLLLLLLLLLLRLLLHISPPITDTAVLPTTGATVATGGGVPAGLETGFYVQPTIFTDVNRDSWIWNEEIFGPVLPVLRWEHDGDVNAIVAHNPHPLAMYFFSKRNDAEPV